MPDPTGRVFLSYRREDSRHIAGRLADRLTGRFDRVQVFMDVDTIAPGDDYGDTIRGVSSCDALIAIIGPKWLSTADSQGRRRLDNPQDWVRQEIGTALSRDIRVIPILVDGAEMPNSIDLPADLTGLCQRNTTRIDHETFSTDVHRLLDPLGQSYARMQTIGSAGPTGPYCIISRRPTSGSHLPNTRVTRRKRCLPCGRPCTRRPAMSCLDLFRLRPWYARFRS